MHGNMESICTLTEEWLEITENKTAINQEQTIKES